MEKKDEDLMVSAFVALEKNQITLKLLLRALEAPESWKNRLFYFWLPMRKEIAQTRILLRAHEVAKKYIENGDPRPAARLILSLSRRAQKAESEDNVIMEFLKDISEVGTVNSQNIGRQLAELSLYAK